MFEEIGSFFVRMGVPQAICATIVTLAIVYKTQIGEKLSKKKKPRYLSFCDKMEWESVRCTLVCRKIMFDATPESFTNRERRAYDNILYRAFAEALPAINRLVLKDFIEKKSEKDCSAYNDATGDLLIGMISEEINKLYHDTDFAMPRKELWRKNHILIPQCKQELALFLNIINAMDRTGIYDIN